MNKIKLIFIALVLSIGFITLSFKLENKNMDKTHTNSLTYVVRPAKNTSLKSPLLVLLHGHGSNENDLFGLANSVHDNWNVVSVRGPYQLAENSYRWYDVKMENGKIVISITQEEESRKKLMDLISEISKKHNVDTAKIIVAGFSQGANMAQSIGLGSPKIAAGFGVFSGRFVEEFIPYINTSTVLKTSRAFISHGSGDNMLPKTYADENRAKLNDLGIEITYSEDTNAHSISPKQWKEFCNWLVNFN